MLRLVVLFVISCAPAFAFDARLRGLKTVQCAPSVAPLEASRHLPNNEDTPLLGRQEFLRRNLGVMVAVLGSGATTTLPANADADAAAAQPKLRNLSDEELLKIVRSDLLDRSFLTTARLTREIYDESATFTDAIDTYTLPKWIQGTQKLFVGDKSRVDLVGDIALQDNVVSFRFDEDLKFNLPLVKPVVHLTGTVELTRDPESGLITKYLEIWDQDVNSVLKTAKL